MHILPKPPAQWCQGYLDKVLGLEHPNTPPFSQAVLEGGAAVVRKDSPPAESPLSPQLCHQSLSESLFQCVCVCKGVHWELVREIKWKQVQETLRGPRLSPMHGHSSLSSGSGLKLSR